MAVSPEEIGRCGCWQVLAVERTSYDLGQPATPPTVEVGYYASSVTVDERDAAQMAAAIRGHWSAIENGTHYRRDVTLGEDACRVADRNAAAVLASLRNLAIALYELSDPKSVQTIRPCSTSGAGAPQTTAPARRLTPAVMFRSLTRTRWPLPKTR